MENSRGLSHIRNECEEGKIRKIETRKYMPVYHDRLGRPVVVFHNPKGAISEYIEDLMAMTFGPAEGQVAVVKAPELVRIMPEPQMIPAPKNRKCRQIRCIDTGEVFKSYAACARHFGFNYDKFYDTYKATGKFEGHEFEEVEG